MICYSYNESSLLVFASLVPLLFTCYPCQKLHVSLSKLPVPLSKLLVSLSKLPVSLSQLPVSRYINQFVVFENGALTQDVELLFPVAFSAEVWHIASPTVGFTTTRKRDLLNERMSYFYMVISYKQVRGHHMRFADFRLSNFVSQLLKTNEQYNSQPGIIRIISN